MDNLITIGKLAQEILRVPTQIYLHSMTTIVTYYDTTDQMSNRFKTTMDSCSGKFKVRCSTSQNMPTLDM